MMREKSRSTSSRRLSTLLVTVGVLLGLAAVAPAPAMSEEPASLGEWREYTSADRQWREKCELYSSEVTRCRVEIFATNVTWDGAGFSVKNRWTFNNLIYKPSARKQWLGNPLATPGEHRIDGRLWRTQCETAWTGGNGCRSEMLAYVPHFDGTRYVNKVKWVFNNTVQFIPGTGTLPNGSPSTVITQTTADEVSSTYRQGCPVGPENLKTIRINQLDLEGEVHRGEIIVASYLADRVANSFEQMFAAGFQVAQMRNPNIWGGSDEKMMYANNTSGFNCRRVVGNPSRLSPHSYGTAVDINPVQNPYRDPTGRWWPSTAYSTNRPAGTPGLHTESSASVTALKSNGFSWFSGWDWHHFEAPRVSPTALTVDPRAASPVTAGELDTSSLARPQGWDEAVLDGSVDDGFTGNGTWLHAVDAATKGTDVLAVGCAPTTTDAPVPVAALEGNLVADGRPGVSIAMQFASDGEAADYFAAWKSQKMACTGASVTELGGSEGTWLGQWDVDGSVWSEVAGQRGDTVKLTLLDAELATAELEMVAAEF
ncbi:MAG: M15 family metallopeptidase [Arachnia sp.]